MREHDNAESEPQKYGALAAIGPEKCLQHPNLLFSPASRTGRLSVDPSCLFFIIHQASGIWLHRCNKEILLPMIQGVKRFGKPDVFLNVGHRVTADHRGAYIL